MALVPLLVWGTLLLVAASCWKWLLGLAVTRFAHGRTFRLSVGQFLFGGVADVCLVLHVGPVRELRISRLSVGLTTKAAAAIGTNGGSGNGDGRSSASGSSSEMATDGGRASGGGLWQALLSGQLLLPIQLQGVSVRLAPSPLRTLVTASEQLGGSSHGSTGGGGARHGRQAKPPLWLLAHLPMQLDGLVLLAEEQGVVLDLCHASLSLHSAQQLVLEGLAATLLTDPDAVAAGSVGDGRDSGPRCGLVAALQGGLGMNSPPGSPRADNSAARRLAQAAAFFRLERLALEHRHDGSFSLQHLQLEPAVAAPGPSEVPKGYLQAVSLQLEAVSLTVSKQLLLWGEQQRRRRHAAKQQHAVAGEGKQLPPRSLADQQQQLLRLLVLLPKEVEAAVQSCTLATERSSSTGLPLFAGFGLMGITCHLAKVAAAPASNDDGSRSSREAAPLATITAGWQQLSANLGPVGITDEKQHLPLPSAVALSSGAAEWSLELCHAATSSSHLSATGKVSMGALCTEVCYPAVQPLVARLLQAAGAIKAAAMPTAWGAAAASSSADASSNIASESMQPAPEQQPNGKQRAPLLAQWRGSVSLGDGSRLLFTDATGRCCWSNSLTSCRLAVQGGSSAATPAVSGSFEADGIEMHALTSAAGSLFSEAELSSPLSLQMLAAKLLRVEVEHSRLSQQQEQGQQAAGFAVDATTAGVHLLMQQEQLAQVASVIVSLMPPLKAAAASSDAARTSGADPLAAVAAAAAVAGSKRSMRHVPQPRLTFICNDTFLLLPTTITVPAEQGLTGQLQLLPAAPALLLSSVSGRLCGSFSNATLEDCCLLYCEGAPSQRFPSSTAALKEQAKVAVVSLDHSTFRKGPVTASGVQGGDDSGSSCGSLRLEVGSLAACADADALLSLALVADNAAQQLALVLAAVSHGRRGSRHGPPRTPKQLRARQPLSVSIGQLRVEQPLYAAGRDMAVEVAAVKVVVGVQEGCQHSLSTATAVLTMAETPVLRWRQLAATLQLPCPVVGGGGRLKALPLAPVVLARDEEKAAPAADGAGSDGQAQEREAGQRQPEGADSYAAYHRARLEAWLDADAVTVPSTAAQVQGSGAAAAALGSGPASTLDAHVSGAELIVPHDAEPGPTQRYAELYFKALETAMRQHLQQLRLLMRQPQPDGGSRPAMAAAESVQHHVPEKQRRRLSLFPMQINLVAEDLALRFEHHPMEAWMASRGPLLQQLAVQQHLWGEVAAVVQPADIASPLHAGMVESAFQTVAAASQQAWDGLLQDLLVMYRSKLQQVDRQNWQMQHARQDPAPGGGVSSMAEGKGDDSGSGRVRAPPGNDLMVIGASRLQGLVVLCCGSEEARAAARQQIAAVDPPSQGVAMVKMLKLHADVALDAFAMRLTGTSRPFVAASHVLISGAAAVARQATAPPQTRERQLPVGEYRRVTIPATIKGCRPPFKFYTDLELEAEALTVCNSQGLEPTLTMVGLAGKRLSPGDPDRSVPRPPPIPWWDDLRYMWRGTVALSVAGFGLTLGGSAHPNISDTSERMEVEASSVRGRLLSGCYELGLSGLEATLHRMADVQQLGGTLLALPFVRAPQATVRLEVDWKLPGGRPAVQHHLFPAYPPPAGALQEPVHAGVVYKAEGWDLSLHVELGQPGDPEAGIAPAVAAGYLGGHQIQWMKQFVAVMNRLPPHMRAVARRGSFFWRKPPPGAGPPKKGIGKLTQKFCLNIMASPLEIVHYAADPADPSHGIHLHAPSCTYAACYLFNQPLLSFLRLPPHARAARPRRPDATRTLTLSMDVQAAGVTVHKADSQRRSPDGALWGSPRASAASTPHAGWVAGRDASEMEGEMLGLLDDLFTPITREQESILAAGAVAVTQDVLAPAALAISPGGDALAEALAPQGSRPLHVLISDCRVLVDRAAKDAVWAAVEHLISAFTTSISQQRRNLSNAAVHSLFPPSASPSPTMALTTSPSMPWSLSSPVAQLQHHVSEAQSARSTPQPASSSKLLQSAQGSIRRSVDGLTPQQLAVAPSGDSSNELLALLLQQRQEAEEEVEAMEPESPAQQLGGQMGDGLLHPGTAEDEDEEDEEALLSSPADNLSGQLQYVVEVRDLQITSEAEAAQGRLLLAARSGRLQGLHLPEACLNVTNLLMEEVSAYVTQMDVDPDAPVLWLQPTCTGYQPPAGQGMLVPVRRIFEPILISLRHSKVAGSSTRRRTNTPSARARLRGSPNASFTASAVRGEELVLRIPEVLAVMDSREFEVLVDVISMLQSPGPSVDTVGAEAALLAELEGDEVEEARRLYALLRQQLAELRLSSLRLRASLGLHAFTCQLAPPSVAAGDLLPPLAVTHFLVGEEADFVAVQFGTAAEMAVAMREHLAAASVAAVEASQEAGSSGAGNGGDGEADGCATASGSTPASTAAAAQQEEEEIQWPAQQRQQQRMAARLCLGERQQEQQQALLLRWVEEQEGDAYEAVQKAKACLLALKAVARKRQPKRSASRLRLQLDRVVWQMCMVTREPFVQASIRRLSLDKFKNKDHSGSAKFVIGRIEVLDSQGMLGPGPGIGPGVILSVWNPDASWERDDMLRVVASMGVPTQTHIVYDHLDVVVHPTAFHLTESIAVAFWEYVFPREDGSKARAAAAFARSVAVPPAAVARHRRSTTALPAGLAASSRQGSPLAGSPMRRTLLAAGDGSSQPSSGGLSPRASWGTPRGTTIMNAGWRSAPSKVHRRTSSLAGEGNLSRQSTLGGSSMAAAAASAAEVSLLEAATDTAAALAGGGSHITFHLQRTSATALEHGGSGSLPSGAAGFTLAGGRLYRPLSSVSLAASEDSAAVHAAPPHRKVRFVHVKLNRAHCRATYEGYPLTFTDLKLVIDNRTYTNIEGRWRDLFNKMKWDIVKSVVKSVAGLQGRKFKELLPEGYPGEEGEGGMRRKPGLLAQLQALGKGRKEGPGAAGEEPVLSGEDLRAQYKRRMLFGQMALPPPLPSAVPATGGAAGVAAGSGVGGATARAVAQLPDESPVAAVVPSAGASLSASPAVQSAAASSSTTLHGGSTVEEVAGGEEVFPGPLAAGPFVASPLASGAPPGPLASGTFGTASLESSTAFGNTFLARSGAFGSIGSLPLAEPEDKPAAASSKTATSGGGSDDPMGVALSAGQPAGAGSSGKSSQQRSNLPTPRWAAKLASKAQKGFHKLRDSLQE